MTTNLGQANQPDILEVIANLSNDAVFTPPAVVNDVLDLLPADVWSDPSLRWLDPAAKTGVFPREITKRLMVGLADAFPEPDERLRHILQEMVFAIATEEITAMMTRRSLYCAREASAPLSAVSLTTAEGHVWHQRVEHIFKADGRCAECKGSKEQLEKPGVDNKAYAFIHEAGRQEIAREITMKFDVIVGNPPYQMDDGGTGGSATPIYNTFVDMAKSLNPQHIAMIVPSRWMSGGKGLDSFRASMLADRRLRTLLDFHDAGTLFPGINLNGGVCYFHWDHAYDGDCAVTSVHKSGKRTTMKRRLDEHDVFVRLNDALPILTKVQARGEPPFSELVSAQKPFGFRTNFRGHDGKRPAKAVTLYAYRSQSWVKRDEVTVNTDWIDRFKVLVPMATDGNEIFPLPILTPPLVVEPGTACTETYLVIGPFDSKVEAENGAAYMRTRLFRFLLMLRKPTQHNSRDKFAFVPRLDLKTTWTDEALRKRYGITESEWAYIEEMIRELPA